MVEGSLSDVMDRRRKDSAAKLHGRSVACIPRIYRMKIVGHEEGQDQASFSRCSSSKSRPLCLLSHPLCLISLDLEKQGTRSTKDDPWFSVRGLTSLILEEAFQDHLNVNTANDPIIFLNSCRQ